MIYVPLVPAHIGLFPDPMLIAAVGNSLTVMVTAFELIDAHVEF